MIMAANTPVTESRSPPLLSLVSFNPFSKPLLLSNVACLTTQRRVSSLEYDGVSSVSVKPCRACSSACLVKSPVFFLMFSTRSPFHRRKDIIAPPPPPHPSPQRRLFQPVVFSLPFTRMHTNKSFRKWCAYQLSIQSRLDEAETHPRRWRDVLRCA